MFAPKAAAALRLVLDDGRNLHRVQGCPLELARRKGELEKLSCKIQIPMPCERGRSVDTGQMLIIVREQLLRRRCRNILRWRRNHSLCSEYD